MFIWQAFSLVGLISILGNFWQFVTSDRLRNSNNLLKSQQEELQDARNKLEIQRQELIAQVARLEGDKGNLEEKLRMEQTIEQRSCEKADFYCAKLSENSKTALLANNSEFAKQIEGMLKPFRDDIAKFRDDQTKFNADAESRVGRLDSMNDKMRGELEKFINATRGNSQQAGRWGEYMLEHCLSLAELQKGKHYELQRSINIGDGEDAKVGRPDAVVRLPDGKLVIIDAKVSLPGYRGCAGDIGTDASHVDAEQQKKDMVSSIKNHIQTLKEREYHKSSESAVESVLMFVPSESVFVFIVQSGLWHEASKKGISVVSPTTLPVVLNLIYLSWRNKDQEAHVQQIADSAAKLYDKFVGVCEAWRSLGGCLNQMSRAYNVAVTRMSGRGGLRYRILDLKSKGIASAKELPEIPLAEANIDYEHANEDFTENPEELNC